MKSQNEKGQLMILLGGIVVVLLLVVGVAIDVFQIYTTRQKLNFAAEQATREIGTAWEFQTAWSNSDAHDKLFAAFRDNLKRNGIDLENTTLHPTSDLGNYCVHKTNAQFFTKKEPTGNMKVIIDCGVRADTIFLDRVLGFDQLDFTFVPTDGKYELCLVEPCDAEPRHPALVGLVFEWNKEIGGSASPGTTEREQLKSTAKGVINNLDAGDLIFMTTFNTYYNGGCHPNQLTTCSDATWKRNVLLPLTKLIADGDTPPTPVDSNHYSAARGLRFMTKSQVISKLGEIDDETYYTTEGSYLQGGIYLARKLLFHLRDNADNADTVLDAPWDQYNPAILILTDGRPTFGSWPPGPDSPFSPVKDSYKYPMSAASQGSHDSNYPFSTCAYETVPNHTDPNLIYSTREPLFRLRGPGNTCAWQGVIPPAGRRARTNTSTAIWKWDHFNNQRHLLPADVANNLQLGVGGAMIGSGITGEYEKARALALHQADLARYEGTAVYVLCTDCAKEFDPAATGAGSDESRRTHFMRRLAADKDLVFNYDTFQTANWWGKNKNPIANYRDYDQTVGSAYYDDAWFNPHWAWGTKPGIPAKFTYGTIDEAKWHAPKRRIWLSRRKGNGIVCYPGHTQCQPEVCGDVCDINICGDPDDCDRHKCSGAVCSRVICTSKSKKNEAACKSDCKTDLDAYCQEDFSDPADVLACQAKNTPNSCMEDAAGAREPGLKKMTEEIVRMIKTTGVQ